MGSTPRSLRPGYSAEFFIPLKADAPQMRVGTLYFAPKGKIQIALDPWLIRIRQWLRMKPAAATPIEAWCPEPLQLPQSPQPDTPSKSEQP
jgi:hypothetical protein